MTSLFHSPDNPFLDKVRADKCFTLKVIKALSTLSRCGGVHFPKQGCENCSVLAKEIKKSGGVAVKTTQLCHTGTGTERKRTAAFPDPFVHMGYIPMGW